MVLEKMIFFGKSLSTREARVAFCDSYASLTLSNFPHASITQKMHDNHETIIIIIIVTYYTHIRDNNHISKRQYVILKPLHE